MKWKLYFFTLLFLYCINCSGQSTAHKDPKPKSGTYTYSVAFAEWNGKSLGATCIVIINGDSITVFSGENLTGEKGTIMDEGIIMKHTKTGKWIIGHSQKDKDAKDIGGCSSGPSVIEFKKKRFWSC